jgi:hypothetical protein
MAKRSDFENDLIARGAAARLYELKIEQRQLEAILKKYGKKGSVSHGRTDDPALAPIARETAERTREIYLKAKAETRATVRGERKQGRRRKMSPEARKAISDAQKKRWAKQKASKS